MDTHTLRNRVTIFFRRSIEQKRLPNWWRDPLLATAEADDRFDILPQIAAKNHLLPRDLLSTCRSVVVFFLPFHPDVSEDNIRGAFAGDAWGTALTPTNKLIESIGAFIRGTLSEEGYASELTPATYHFNAKAFTARWSHKHLAHIAGLGRFGVNAQLITPSGCAGRLGSLVTNAPLGNHPLVGKEELCLHKAGYECLRCVQACPVRAIEPDGILRPRCNQRLQVNRKRFAARPDMAKDMEVCAKCVSGMPCSLRAPI